MTFLSWLKQLVTPRSRVGAGKGRPRNHPLKRTRYIRPLLEALEDRTLLDAVKWNVAANGFWDMASNWLDTNNNQTVVPSSTDTVTINQPGVTVTIRSGSQSINNLQCADNLSLTGGSLTLAAASEIDGTLSVGSGTTLTANDVLTLKGSASLGGTVSGSLAGTGTGTINLTSDLTIGTGGATFNFAAGMFQWSSNGINLDGNTLINTGSMTISGSGSSLNG